MKELTKAEEQIMQVLWDSGSSFVRDIIDRLPEPHPAYNTVSTIVRILEAKGFVGHKAYGKTHEYYPLISRDTYAREYLGSMVRRYFSNSFRQMVSFFAEHQNLSLGELEEIRKIMDEKIREQKNH